MWFYLLLFPNIVLLESAFLLYIILYSTIFLTVSQS